VTRILTVVCAAALSVLPTPLAAQARWRLSLGASGGGETVRSRSDSLAERLSGAVFTGEAMATRERFVLRLRYGQGHVTAGSATVMARDVAEGEALLGYTARPWLTLWFGPHARTYGTALGDQRWLFWSARVGVRGNLFPGRLESFVELWQGFSGRVSRPASSAAGRGAEAGLQLRLASRPLWGRLAYRVEQGRIGASRRETVEAITLTVGYVPLR
jgi:hypothetical protein